MGTSKNFQRKDLQNKMLDLLKNDYIIKTEERDITLSEPFETIHLLSEKSLKKLKEKNSLASLATHTSKGQGAYTVPDPEPGNGALKEEGEENYNRGERSGLYASEEHTIFLWEI